MLFALMYEKILFIFWWKWIDIDNLFGVKSSIKWYKFALS
jgi:hypothetical protein